MRYIVNRLEYFEKITNAQFHEFVYELETQNIEAGEILLKEGDETNDLIIVGNGCLEIYSEFDGNEFILDFLPRGTILNQTVIFIEDLMYVNVRAVVNTEILKFSKEDFERM